MLEREYRKKWRTVAGTLGVALIMISIFLMILLIAGVFKIGLDSVSLILGCLGIGAILLLMAISYKQVKAKLR